MRAAVALAALGAVLAGCSNVPSRTGAVTCFAAQVGGPACAGVVCAPWESCISRQSRGAIVPACVCRPGAATAHECGSGELAPGEAPAWNPADDVGSCEDCGG